MSQLVFFLEEQSAEELIKGLLPRLKNDVDFRCITFEGKQDLEKQLSRKMKGWLVPGARFVILRDQDSAACEDVKANLLDLCRQSGKQDFLVRIACHELESWYLGDLEAVAATYQMPNIAQLQSKRKFQDPDSIVNPCDEMDRITARQYRHISGSREIAANLNLESNRSHSFKIFLNSIKRVIGQNPQT